MGKGSLRGQPIGGRGPLDFGVTQGQGADPKGRDCLELGGVLELQA